MVFFLHFFSTVVARGGGGGGPFGEESKTSGMERFVSYALDCAKGRSGRYLVVWAPTPGVILRQFEK